MTVNEGTQFNFKRPYFQEKSNSIGFGSPQSTVNVDLMLDATRKNP